MRPLLHLFVVAAVLTAVGCASPEKTPEEQRLEQLQDDLNYQWRQGYGFNNPNIERQKKGLPPQNFDGSIGDKDDDTFLGSLLSSLFD